MDKYVICFVFDCFGYGKWYLGDKRAGLLIVKLVVGVVEAVVTEF